MGNANIGHVSLSSVPGGGSAPRTLRETTQEFESLFISKMMQSMRASVPESGLFGSGSGQQVFRDMLDQELSREVAHSGGFGIGEMLLRELGGAQETSTADRTQENGNDEDR